MSAQSQSSDNHGTSHGHVAPMSVLVGTFLALVLLTIITVAVAYVDLGEFNLIIAMLIATIKASLVALFFMHLLHDSGFNRLAFFGCFFFVMLFVGFTLMDTGQNQPVMDWHETVLKTNDEAK